MLLTFFLAVVGWIIFRSSGMPSCLNYFRGMIQFGTLRASYRFFTLPEMWPTNLFIVIMLLVEWLQRGKEHGMEIKDDKLFKVKYVRWLLYLMLVLCCIWEFLSIGKSNFIYFQF